MLRKVCYQVFTARFFSTVHGDLSADRVPNVNYVSTHPEWNIDTHADPLLYFGETCRYTPRAHVLARCDRCVLYTREEIILRDELPMRYQTA